MALPSRKESSALGRFAPYRACLIQLALLPEIQDGTGFFVLQKLSTLILASTGAAAVLLGGATVHAGFGIRPDKSRGSTSKSLRPELKQSFQNKYQALCAVIIDEVSMVGQDLLYRVNERLNEIFEIRDPSVTYGGKVMFFVGDLLQLPAVMAKSIFDTEMSRRVGPEGAVLDLWREVRMVELKEVVRTRGDPKYGDVMSRVRLGVQNEDDIAYLQQRTLTCLGKKEEVLKDIMHIFPTNKLVNEYNRQQMDALSAEWAADDTSCNPATYQTTVKALTVIADESQRKYFKGDASKLAPDNINDCGGLVASLRLVKNMPIVFRQNVDVGDGIANGSLARLKAWVPKKRDKQGEHTMPAYLLVHMKEAKGKVLGDAARKKFRDKEPRIVEILKQKKVWDERMVAVEPAVSSFLCKRKKTLLTRQQFPIAPAFASTIHRVQGATFEQLVISLDWTGHRPAQAYTALSRLTSHEGLFFIAFNPACIKTNVKGQVELQELRKRSGLPLVDLPPEVKEEAEKQERLQNWKERRLQQGKQTPQPPRTYRAHPPSNSTPSHVEPAVHVSATVTPNIQVSAKMPRRLENVIRGDNLLNHPVNEHFSERSVTGEEAVVTLPPYIRLRNNSNFCFANTALQCLYHIPPIKVWANGATKRDMNTLKRRLAEQLRMLFLSGATPSMKDAKNTEPIVQSYHSADYPFNDGRQHDGQEFLEQILRESEIADNGGPLNCGFWSITTCDNPGCIREPYTTNETGGAAIILIKRPRTKTQFRDIIDSQLTENVVANCDDCKVDNAAKKKTLKFSFNANYCILCLTPFHAEGRLIDNVGAGTSRANGFVAGFSQDRICIDGTNFRVIAAVEHIGRSLESGHYVAYLRQPDSQWLRISDAHTPDLKPHLPLGLVNIYYLVLQKLGINQGEEELDIYHRTNIQHMSDTTENRQLELVDASFYGISYFKNIPTNGQIHERLKTIKRQPSRHSCWYFHNSGEIVVFVHQSNGAYKELPVRFHGSFGILHYIGENKFQMEEFYLVLKKGTRDFSLISASMDKKDWRKAESYMRSLLKPLPEISEPDTSTSPTATTTPQKKRGHQKATTDGSPSTSSPLAKLGRRRDMSPGIEREELSNELWTGTAYGIRRSEGEESLTTILAHLETASARPHLRTFPFRILHDHVSHQSHLYKITHNQSLQLVARWYVKDLRLLKFVAEKVRRFVLVVEQGPVWFHLLAKLDVGQDSVKLEDALSPSLTVSLNCPRMSALHGALSHPIKWSDWVKTKQIPVNTPTHTKCSQLINSHVFLFRGDILSVKVDMITNAANPDLLKGDGIDDHIHKAAGWDTTKADYKLRIHCKSLGGCPVGSAKVTPSFNIAHLDNGNGAKWIVHAVGPNVKALFLDSGKAMCESIEGMREAQRLLASSYTAALQCALDVGAKSIALPCISTGIYGYVPRLAADVAATTVRAFFQDYQDRGNNNAIELDVIFCLYSAKDEAYYESALPRHFPLH